MKLTKGLMIPLLLCAVSGQAASLMGMEALGQENTQRGGATIRKGYSYLNPALLAWEDKTTFNAQLRFENATASESGSSLSAQSFSVPSLSMGLPLGFLGAVGIGLQQHYTVDNLIEYSDSSTGIDEKLEYQGSIFEAVPAYALRLPSVLRDVSVGVNYRVIFGSIRRTLSMSGQSTDLAAGDTWAYENARLTDKVEGNWEATGAMWKRFGGSVQWHRKSVDYFMGYTQPYTLRRDLSRNLQFSNTDTLRPVQTEQYIHIPAQMSTGMHMRFGKSHNITAEFSQQGWDGAIPLLSGGWGLPDSAELQTQKIFSLEYELEGSGLYYDSFLKRNSYRFGTWFKDWYLSEVSEYGATVGMGLPLGRRGTRMDFSIQGGLRSDSDSPAWDETFWGVQFGFTGVGSWGQKSRRY